MTLPGYFWDMWPYFADKLSWDITTTQVNSALHPSGVAKSSTSFGWGKGGKVTSAVWQVTLCDLIWHVISRSGVVISITNCYIRFTLLYFIWKKRLNTSNSNTCNPCVESDADWTKNVTVPLYDYLYFTCILEKRRNRQDLIEVFKISQGKSIIGLQDLFTLDKNNKGTRGHTLKLSKMRCTRDSCIFL